MIISIIVTGREQSFHKIAGRNKLFDSSNRQLSQPNANRLVNYVNDFQHEADQEARELVQDSAEKTEEGGLTTTETMIF